MEILVDTIESSRNVAVCQPPNDQFQICVLLLRPVLLVTLALPAHRRTPAHAVIARLSPFHGRWEMRDCCRLLVPMLSRLSFRLATAMSKAHIARYQELAKRLEFSARGVSITLSNGSMYRLRMTALTAPFPRAFAEAQSILSIASMAPLNCPHLQLAEFLISPQLAIDIQFWIRTALLISKLGLTSFTYRRQVHCPMSVAIPV